MAQWTRNDNGKPPRKRRMMLSYDPARKENAILEVLLERTPYGATNSTLMECLRIGAPALLAQRGAPAALQAIAPTPAPAAAPTFSASAQRMFDQK